MKWFSRTVFTVWVCFLAIPSVFADSSMKANVLLAGEIQSWLSGPKRRMEVQIPVAGKVVTITRLDQGVEWILNPARKIYQVRPIALPYQPSEEPSGSQDETTSQENSEEENQTSDCQPRLSKLPKTKTIAGFTTVGFSMACQGKSAQGTIWMAPPLGVLARVSQEWTHYYQAHATALYANFPADERAVLITQTAQLGETLRNLLASRLGPTIKFPQGVIMEVEGKWDEKVPGPFKTVYEVKEIRSDAVNPGLFEIPAGYQEVPDITKAILKSSLQNFQQMFETAKQFFTRFNSQGGNLQGNPFQSVIDWAKKSYAHFTSQQKSAAR